MQPLFVIEALFDEESTRAVFLNKFRSRQDGRLMRFIFDDPQETASAAALLSALKVKHQVFFRFRMAHGELYAYPAVYLGLQSLPAIVDGVLDPSACNGCQLFSDYVTGWLCASNEVRQLLDPLVLSMNFHPLGSKDRTIWFRLDARAKLAHPIEVVVPVDVVADEDLPARVSVRGDGRSIIRDEDAALVRENGIAVADRCLIAGDERDWHPRHICSGLIMATLLDNQIRGVLEPPAPILPEGSAWADATINSIANISGSAGST